MPFQRDSYDVIIIGAYQLALLLLRCLHKQESPWW